MPLLPTEVKYVGIVLSEDGVKPDPEKIEAVANWPVPKRAKELSRFLGFVVYNRRFIEGFAKIAGPQYNLLNEFTDVTTEKHGHSSKKKRTVNYSSKPFGSKFDEKCQAVFDGLKQALLSEPVLGFADFTSDFYIKTDVSHSGLGLILYQLQDEKNKS